MKGMGKELSGLVIEGVCKDPIGGIVDDWITISLEMV